MSNFKKFINEVGQEHLDRIEDYLEDLTPEDLPFDDIFQNKYRKVIPFEDSKLAIIKNLIKNYYTSENFPQLASHHIDWSNGQIVNKFKNANAGKTVVDKKTREEKIVPDYREKRTNIAKFLRNSNDESLLSWWSNFMDTSAISPEERESIADSTGKYSIVFTRHPIDILRMSDHKNISSCHSPDGSEFKSCKQETVDGGGMAFLVNSEDLNDIDINAPEIFADNDRDIDGIEPESRIRIRRYTSKFDDKKTGEPFDFAVPETSIYGMRSEGFKDKVLKFFQQEQEDLVKRNGGRENFRIKNFTLRGGKYRDSSDASLFNKFFKDSIDQGNTVYSYEGKQEFVDLSQQYEEELEQIEKEYNDTLKHGTVSYYIHEDWGDDYPFTYDMTGTIEIAIPSHFVEEIPEEEDILGRYGDSSGSLRDELEDYSIYISREQTHISEGPSGDLFIDLYKDSSDSSEYNHHYGDDGLHPDAFTEFCNDFQREFDEEYDKIVGIVKDWMIQRGFAKPTPARILEDKIFEEEIRLQNFDLTDREGDNLDQVEIIADQELTVKVPSWPDVSSASASSGAGNIHKKLTNMQMDRLISQIEAMLIGTINAKHGAYEKQKWLPIVNKPANPYNYVNNYDLEEGLPEIRVKSNYTNRISIVATFILHDDDLQEKVDKIEANLMQLDKNWTFLMTKVQAMIDSYFKGIEEDILLQQRQQQDQQKLSGLLGSKNPYWSVKSQKPLYPELEKPRTKGDEYRDMILRRGKYAPKPENPEKESK